MAKVIRGTKDAKGNLILKGGQGGISKIRCPTCGNLAQPDVSNVQGYACANCGSKFKLTRM